MMTEGEDYIKKFNKMQSARSQSDTHWQDISLFTLPSRDFYNSYAPGSKRNTKIYDITAMYANEQLAGGLHGLLTSQAAKWFLLGIENKNIRVSEAMKVWLQDTEDKMYAVFNNAEGGFSTQSHEMYLETSAFGNGIMYEEIANGAIRFRCFQLADCYYEENAYGVVDTMYRRVRMTAKQAMGYFGEKASKNIVDKYNLDPLSMIEILHVVEPRIDNGGPNSQKHSKPFSSCYLDVKDKAILDEGGFDMFPYQVVRFSKRSGETYGFGPGGAALPATKMVNRMAEVNIRGVEKLVDPPLLVPDDGVIQNITLQPGGINVYRAGSDKIEPLITNTKPEIAFQAIEKVQSDIMRQFYVDWLTLPSNGPQMTATEVLDRRDKSLRLLSPMLARMQNEFLGNLIKRVFYLMGINGMLSPMPAEMQGVKMKITYISPMAQAQKMTEIDSIQRGVQLGAGLAGVDGGACMQNLDTDATFRYVMEKVLNVPEIMMRSIPARDAMRKQQQQQQEQTQQANNAVLATKAVQQAGGAVQSLATAQAAGNA